jgi:hypothetical protein
MCQLADMHNLSANRTTRKPCLHLPFALPLRRPVTSGVTSSHHYGRFSLVASASETTVMAERDLYSRVAHFADSDLALSFVHENVGTRLGKIDVLAIQELWGDLVSDTEIVAIEVKNGVAAYLSSVGQALSYSVYAHRCYLAVRIRRGQHFTREKHQVAAQFGIKN